MKRVFVVYESDMSTVIGRLGGWSVGQSIGWLIGPLLG